MLCAFLCLVILSMIYNMQLYLYYNYIIFILYLYIKFASVPKLYLYLKGVKSIHYTLQW